MSNYNDYIEKAREFLATHGIMPDALNCSGENARCGTVNHPNSENGWYRFHLDDTPLVTCINWDADGLKHTCSLYDSKEWKKLTEAEREERREAFRQKQEEARRELEKKRQEAAREAEKRFSTLPLAGENNAYLKRKGVLPLGDIRQDKDGRLVLPVLGEAGKKTSLQFIAGDGGKQFLPGGAIGGGYFPIPAKDGGKAGPLLIAEGYATAASLHMATGYAVLVAFNAGNLDPVGRMARAQYPGREIILCADNDIHEDGKPNTGVLKATEAAKAIGAKLAICPAIRGHKADFNDLFTDTEDGPDKVRVRIEKAMAEAQPKKSAYRCVNIGELVEKEFPPRTLLLDPVFAVQSLNMVYAFRGIGKTHFALSCAYAVASGGGVFGNWFAPSPARVLYIDGEMPEVTLQERLKAIALGADSTITDPDFLRILTPDEQEAAMPNLATKEGQEAIEPFLDGVSLVVVDNLATLARTGKANDEDSWMPVQGWLLDLRRRGISVLLVHHANKSGTQRGTVAKEDILDTVLELKRPSDYQPSEGARFEVHFSKARGLYGADVEPFEAKLSLDDDTFTWTTRKVEDVVDGKIADLLKEGLSVRAIQEELQGDRVGQARIARVRQKLEEQGVHIEKSKGGAGTHKARK